MISVATITLVIASLLVLVSLLQPVAARAGLPYTVVLAVAGVALGGVASFLLYTPLTDAFNAVVAPLVNLPFDSAVFLDVFLPLLLFESALGIDIRELMEDAAPILMLAIVAVFVAALGIGYALSLAGGIPLLVALLLGSIVATTDPAAVVAIFQNLGAPARLVRLVQGEALLNDAAAIVLFNLLLAMLTHGEQPDVLHGLVRFAVTFFGGIVLGAIGGRVFGLIVPLLDNMRTAEATLSVALPYLLYELAERVFDVSGVVAVVSAALTVGVLGRSRLMPENWRYLERVWEQIGFWAGSLIFVTASLLVPKLLVGSTVHDLYLLGIMLAAAFGSRALVLFGLLPALSALRLAQKVSAAYKIAITWGGLRGAVTLALALAVTEDAELDPAIQHLVAVLATGFVLFTLLVGGLTLQPLVSLLGLDRLSPLNQALRSRVLALALTEVRDSVRQIARDYHVSPEAEAGAVGRYDARIAEAVSSGSAEIGLTDRDRVRVGLVALAERETHLVLDHHGLRTVSPAVVEKLLRHARDLLDRARSEGRTGYNRAAQAVLAYPRSLRVAHFLHMRFGLEALLRHHLADRFEALLLLRLVVESLVRFNRERLAPLLGERVADILDEVLQVRGAGVARAVEALRLQYPDHADALEERVLRQSALRLEHERISALRQDGLIDRELFQNLEQAQRAERLETRRPPALDLGLRSEELVRRFALFDGLEEAERAGLVRMLRPRLALPEERIIRKGERGRAMYFISSGAVEVVLADRKVRLGRGDFFGEMALSLGRRRQADVVAIGYCRLLELTAADFEHFLAAHPAAQAVIDRTTRQRTAMNADRSL